MRHKRGFFDHPAAEIKCGYWTIEDFEDYERMQHELELQEDAAQEQADDDP